ncbi:hypothetical protein EW146_g2855 [Bondarzewia mesenterica]|uniref:J domain-containing protein n=1 Tax=Bondarzewia mesenterica TaxID=1095465 RepID=A0A4S4M0W5_9AGAM|nr:hypothetical protein EW146_g2855 [Bondarzewia mesenterica]
MSMPAPDYYGVFGIRRSANTDDVRKAYKQRLLESHPDRLGPGASEGEMREANEQFSKVREAFEVLGDAEKRRAYDIHTRNLPTPSSSRWKMSEEQLRRTKDRVEWAERLKKRSEERLRAIRETAQAKVEAERKAAAEYAALVETMMQELYTLSPEWLERKQRIQMVRLFINGRGLGWVRRANIKQRRAANTTSREKSNINTPAS